MCLDFFDSPPFSNRKKQLVCWFPALGRAGTWAGRHRDIFPYTEHVGPVLYKVQEGGLQNGHDESGSNHSRLSHACLFEEQFLTEGKLYFRKMKPLILSQPDMSSWRLGEPVDCLQAFVRRVGLFHEQGADPGGYGRP